MILLAILFSILSLGVALLNIPLLVHGAASLPIVALVHLVASLLLIWTAFAFLRKKPKTIPWYALFIVLGLIPLPIGLSLGTLTREIDETMMERRDRGVQVINLGDEPFISKKGHLVGLKFRFSVTVPKNDYYSLHPSFQLPDEVFHQAWEHNKQNFFDMGAFRLKVIKVESDPPLPLPVPEPWSFLQRGKLYRFTLYAVPGYLIPQGKENFCLWSPPTPSRETFDSINGFETPASYRIVVHHSGVALEVLSQTQFSPKALYDGIRQEGFPNCEPGMGLYGGDVLAHDL